MGGCRHGLLEATGEDDDERASPAGPGWSSTVRRRRRRRGHLRARRAGARRDRATLRERLATLGAPHRWEGTSLVDPGADEAWAERVMDQVEDELSALSSTTDVEQVAYDLAGWDDDAVALLDALAADDGPVRPGRRRAVRQEDRRAAGRRDRGRPHHGRCHPTEGGQASSRPWASCSSRPTGCATTPTTGATRASSRARAPRPAPAPPYRHGPGWWHGVGPGAGALAELIEPPTPTRRRSSSGHRSAPSCGRTSDARRSASSW